MSNTTSQTSSSVFMVRPVNFGYNEQTASSNAFQCKSRGNVSDCARQESDNYIKLLKDKGINVIDVEDSEGCFTPDSIFPNNWFSTHEDGTLVLYPMCAPNRRLERKEIFLSKIKENFNVKRILDLTYFENEGLFLEGTGSMVLDRVNKVAYACSSPRTSKTVLEKFCGECGYTYVLFNAEDENGKAIYHTNVLMSIGSDFAVVCLKSIRDESQRYEVINRLTDAGKDIIDITFSQMNSFAGNTLELKNTCGEQFIVMSKTAVNSLNEKQLDILKSRCSIICPDIQTIEKNGGGSARCMLAEIF